MAATAAAPLWPPELPKMSPKSPPRTPALICAGFYSGSWDDRTYRLIGNYLAGGFERTRPLRESRGQVFNRSLGSSEAGFLLLMFRGRTRPFRSVRLYFILRPVIEIVNT